MVLWVERVWRGLIEDHGEFQQEKIGINSFVCAVFHYVAEKPKSSIKDHDALLPTIPLGIVAYGFVGQSFSKQLFG